MYKLKDEKMGAIFNLDNPVWNFMSKVADLIILNILAIVCSVPIVTIGTSWTAMYFVTIRMVRKEESYIVKDFFRSFKENFKQSTIIWLIALAAIAIFAGDVMIYRMIPEQIPQVLMIAVLILAYLVLGTIIYVFPLLSRFHNTTKGTIKNAFLVSIVNVPYTLVFVVLLVIPIIIAFFVIEAAPFILLFGFSLPAYIASIFWVRIFKKFEPKEETVQEAEGAEEMPLE